MGQGRGGREGERTSMTQTPMGLVRVAAIAWCAAHPLASSACASHKAPHDAAPPPAPSRVEPVTLRVTNANWSDVRIYLVRSGMWLRLGLVTSYSSAEFTVPPDFTGQSGSVIVVARPVAGRGSWSQELNGILPGDELELSVENLLQYSHLVVR